MHAAQTTIFSHHDSDAADVTIVWTNGREGVCAWNTVRCTQQYIQCIGTMTSLIHEGFFRIVVLTFWH